MKYILSLFIFTVIFSNEVIDVENHKIGIFHQYKYQFSDNIEIGTHPIAFLVNPNISVRIKKACLKAFTFFFPAILFFSNDGNDV